MEFKKKRKIRILEHWFHPKYYGCPYNSKAPHTNYWGCQSPPPRHPRIDASDGITQRKLASLILLLQSDPSQTLLSGDILVSNTKYVQILIVNTVSCSTWRQTTDDINQADRRLTAGAINWEL